MKKYASILRCLPFWAIALLIDGLIYAVMVSADTHLCGVNSSCFRLDAMGDRYTDYLALVVAIMAILIPVAIELWREQFRSHNLKRPSLLDAEWSRMDRNRHLNEPVGAAAVFVCLSLLLPLLINTTALFYAAMFYGIYLLVYVFSASFYRKPLNIYQTSGLNPGNGELPSPDIMGELINITFQTSEDGGHTQDLTSIWLSQINEQETLKKLGDWVRITLRRDEKQHLDATELYVWTLMQNFLRKCQVEVIWQSVIGGDLKTILQDERLYDSFSIDGGSKILSSVIQRLVKNEEYYELSGMVLKLVPIIGRDASDLYRILMPSVKSLLFKMG